MFYKIEESIGNGFYITWPGIYLTRQEAVDALERKIAHMKNKPNVRVWPYCKGTYLGPIRLAADCE